MRSAYREIKPYQILNHLKINNPMMLKFMGMVLGGILFLFQGPLYKKIKTRWEKYTGGKNGYSWHEYIACLLIYLS